MPCALHANRAISGPPLGGEPIRPRFCQDIHVSGRPPAPSPALCSKQQRAGEPDRGPVGPRPGEKLIPEREVNDSLILAEAALANCTVLITSDEHLRAADPTLLSLALKVCDVNAILVRTPREIVRQFG